MHFVSKFVRRINCIRGTDFAFHLACINVQYAADPILMHKFVVASVLDLLTHHILNCLCLNIYRQ